LRAESAVGRRLAVDLIDPPDFARRAGLSATRVNLSRLGAGAERDGKTEKTGQDERARPLVQSHAAISDAIESERKAKKELVRSLPEQMGQEKGNPA
jgi:hypothetical protein